MINELPRIAAPIALLLLLAATGEAAVVRLKSTASAGSSLVRLGDVAEIVDPDPQVVEQLRDAALMPSPAPGASARIDFSTIRSRLQALGVNLANVEFTGSSVVMVQRGDAAAGGIGSAEARKADWQHERAQTLISDAIRDHLRRLAPELGGFSLAIELDARDAASVLTAVVDTFEVAGGAAPWNQPQRMTVRYVDALKQLRTVQVECRVTAHASVLALKHAVPAGHILQDTDLAWRPGDDSSAGFSRLEDVLGRETTRTLRAGEIVSADNVKIVPLIRNGDIVTVYSRRPGIAVKRQLKARGEGALGDTVTLVTFDGRQTILARVTAFHEAEVFGASEPGGAGATADRRSQYAMPIRGTQR